MKFTPAETLPGQMVPRNEYEQLLRDFVASGLPLAKVDIDGHRPSSVEMRLRDVNRMLKLPVKVHKRGVEVFLAKAAELGEKEPDHA